MQISCVYDLGQFTSLFSPRPFKKLKITPENNRYSSVSSQQSSPRDSRGVNRTWVDQQTGNRGRTRVFDVFASPTVRAKEVDRRKRSRTKLSRFERRRGGGGGSRGAYTTRKWKKKSLALGLVVWPSSADGTS